MLKIVTIFNWIGICAVAILVLALIFEPSRGGDAATKGLGQAFIIIGLVAMAVLVTLNLLPYNWTKYAGFALIMTPFALFAINAGWGMLKARQSYKPIGFNDDGTPWFRDQQRQTLALAISNSDINKVQTMLQEPQGQALLEKGNEDLTMLEFAVSEATYSTYKPEEKVACVKLLLEAGMKLGAAADSTEMLAGAAFTGNAALTKLLLEHGADANARNAMNSPVLFEAIISYKQPNETVQALLAAGADPNTIYIDSDTVRTSALLRAATVGRWNICRQLIAKGADVRFVSSDGRSVEALVREGGAYFQGDGYSTVEDLKHLKQQLRQ